MRFDGDFTGQPKPDPLLVDLAGEVMEYWRSSEMERRRKLWVEHFRCQKQGKIPVKCAVYDSYDLVWQQLLPEEGIVHKQGVARDIELQLRIKLMKFRRLCDDDVIMPVLRFDVDRGRAPDSLWGVPLSYDSPEMEGGAVRPVPPLKGDEDLDCLGMPGIMPEGRREQDLRVRAAALTGGLLDVRIKNDELHFGPYEWAVRLRGAENLMLDAYDRPEWLHALMDKITTGMVEYHRARERAGMAEYFMDLPRVHVPFDSATQGLENRLAASWVYVHAQSSASLSPAMYEEFVQPYNVRIAQLFGKVYYHGCENLGRKAKIIARLPNLRYFHVSPWTKPADVIPALDGRGVVLEVHSHPTEVLYCHDAAKIRAEIMRLKNEAAGQVFDLKLCDIETIKGAEGKLELWTDIAMEESAR